MSLYYPLVENERRELFHRERSGLIEKQKNLISVCDFLEDKFTRYVSEAEKQVNLTLVIKGNALKRRQTGLKTELKNLQDQIESKRSKLC